MLPRETGRLPRIGQFPCLFSMGKCFLATALFYIPEGQKSIPFCVMMASWCAGALHCQVAGTYGRGTRVFRCQTLALAVE